jgi:hypothetical protein
MNNLSNPQSYSVVICEDNREDLSPYIVVPGRLSVCEGDEVFFKNVTSISVSIEFAGLSPFGESSFSLVSSEGKSLLVIKVDEGGYPYDVYCGDKRDLAYGSRPIIIKYDK